MKWIVYLTTNTVNKKCYCGVYQTEDPSIFDGYIGCGVYVNQPSSYNHPTTLFQQAVHKYGPSKFVRHILKVYDNEDDAYNLESTIVDDRWVSDVKTYNTTSNNYICPITKQGNIYQYNLNGELIGIFRHTTQVAQQLDIDRNSIIAAIYDHIPYMDCYFLKSNIDISTIREKIHKHIYRYLLNGTFDKEFKSIKDIANVYPSKLKRAIIDSIKYNEYLWSNEKVENYYQNR